MADTQWFLCSLGSRSSFHKRHTRIQGAIRYRRHRDHQIPSATQSGPNPKPSSHTKRCRAPGPILTTTIKRTIDFYFDFFERVTTSEREPVKPKADPKGGARAAARFDYAAGTVNRRTRPEANRRHRGKITALYIRDTRDATE